MNKILDLLEPDLIYKNDFEDYEHKVALLNITGF